MPWCCPIRRDAHRRRARALSRCRRSRELAEGERALYAALESGDIAGGVGAWLALQTLPVTAIDVAEALDLGVGEVDAALRVLVAQGSVRKLAAGEADLLADAVVLDTAMDALAATLSAMHAAAPKETGFTPARSLTPPGRLRMKPLPRR